jgi:hypothetical protein
MSDRRVFFLAHDIARSRAAKAVEEAPAGHMVVISEPKRNSAQNALLHALIEEISKKVEWAGKKRDPEVWKRLLVSSWCRIHGESVEILPALDGHGVDIVPVRTSKLSKSECADLITFIEAWGAEQGVVFAEREEAHA